MKKVITLAAIFALSVPVESMATTYTVDALANATTGGTGVSASVISGQSFTITVNPLDLWNAGALPRWSNADGITGSDLLATGAADTNGDNPSVAAGTVIGSNTFGDWTQNGLTAPFGSLVGQFGSGSFFKIGTNYTGIATDSILKLFYFDSYSPDNSGSVIADIVTAAVPEAETYTMVLVGLGIMGFVARRRKQNTNV